MDVLRTRNGSASMELSNVNFQTVGFREIPV
jgi:hypothetical protein